MFGVLFDFYSAVVSTSASLLSDLSEAINCDKPQFWSGRRIIKEPWNLLGASVGGILQRFSPSAAPPDGPEVVPRGSWLRSSGSAPFAVFVVDAVVLSRVPVIYRRRGQGPLLGFSGNWSLTRKPILRTNDLGRHVKSNDICSCVSECLSDIISFSNSHTVIVEFLSNDIVLIILPTNPSRNACCY